MKYIDRIKRLNCKLPRNREFVLYWMQQSQRINYNHALNISIKIANKRRIPLVVLFVLNKDFPHANLRHFTFMVQGLKELEDNFRDREITFIIEEGEFQEVLPAYAKKSVMLITDRGYLSFQRDIRENIAKRVDLAMYQVESDIVVPVEIASDKEEYMARTIRKKINKLREFFLTPLRPEEYKMGFYKKVPYFNFESFLDKLDTTVKPSIDFVGGYSQALKRLDFFLEDLLENYDQTNKSLVESNFSKLSPYLHFGQISPLEIAVRVLNSDARDEAKEAFLEQLIVRRELAINFCYYNTSYKDLLSFLPKWASQSLLNHVDDSREFIYSIKDLEEAKTHDHAWNACQKQLTKTGYMENYMRMYWGKKVIEWTLHPQEAYEILIYLNDKYELDGRDANGYTGVAWCFGKHDTAWKERPIFGKTRYMNFKGLKRKFDIQAYINKWL